jgi:hypothetical protein
VHEKCRENGGERVIRWCSGRKKKQRDHCVTKGRKVIEGVTRRRSGKVLREKEMNISKNVRETFGL